MPESSAEMAAAENDPTSGASSDKATTLWQIEISPDAGQPDRLARNILADARDLGLPASLEITACRGFLIQGALDRSEAVEIADVLLVEPVVEKYAIGRCGDSQFDTTDSKNPGLFYVLPLPGVTDPEAESALLAIQQLIKIQLLL